MCSSAPGMTSLSLGRARWSGQNRCGGKAMVEMCVEGKMINGRPALAPWSGTRDTSGPTLVPPLTRPRRDAEASSRPWSEIPAECACWPFVRIV